MGVRDANRILIGWPGESLGRLRSAPAVADRIHFPRHGVWRSLVAHSLWERGAVGSNPATPTVTYVTATRSTPVKSTVATLSPTRGKLAIEVPFDELTPSLQKAYREIGAQVQVPGFP